METSESILLWLDDIRDPSEDQWKVFFPIPNPSKVVWVKSFKGFCEYIQDNGLPTAISFDHDLADEHYTPEEYWDDYTRSKAYQDKVSQKYTEKTGLDCAKWLVDYCMDNNCNLPLWYTHSANPVGRDNIDRYLINYLRVSG